MTDRGRQSEGPKDVWEVVGDVDRVLVTSDNFQVHVWKSGATWKARVLDQESKRTRMSKLTYASDAAAEAASMDVITEMRERRKAHGTQRSLKL